MIVILAVAWWLEGRAIRRDITTLEQQLTELRAMPSLERAALDLALVEHSALNYHDALTKETR